MIHAASSRRSSAARTGIATAVLVLVAACGGGASASPAASQAPAASAAPSTAPTAAPATPAPASPADDGLDYRGEWSGQQLTGTVRRCAASKTAGFWIGDVSAGMFQVPLSWSFGTGTTADTTIDEPTRDKTIDGLLAGKAELRLDGATPMFILDNGEGHYEITLERGRFCNR